MRPYIEAIGKVSEAYTICYPNAGNTITLYACMYVCMYCSRCMYVCMYVCIVADTCMYVFAW